MIFQSNAKQTQICDRFYVILLKHVSNLVQFMLRWTILLYVILCICAFFFIEKIGLELFHNNQLYI